MLKPISYVLGVAVLCAATPAAAALGGRYQGPLGGLDLKVKGTVVTAISTGGGPCGFKKGQSVFSGQLMDDSLAGKITVCGQGPGCASSQEAFAVLLVAKQGQLLSGAVQLKNKQCTINMPGSALRLTRSTTEPARAKPKPKLQAVTPAAPKEEANIPFAQWSPDQGPAPANGVSSRKDALAKGREAARLLDGGQFEAAREVLSEALRADPHYAEGYLMMGVTYYARNHYDEALDWYKKALTMSPDFGDSYYNIACIYSIENKRPLALKYLRIALLNGYKEKAAMEQDGDLDNVRAEPEYQELLALLAAGPASAPAP